MLGDKPHTKNTRFWLNLAKRRFMLMFWRYISTFNAKKNFQKNYQTYSYRQLSLFFLSFIFATVLINNSFSYTSNVIITNIITTHYTIWIQFKNQRQFCFGNRQYLQREIILECLHQGMGVSNHETNAYFLTKFTLSVHLLASTPRQTLNIFYILKNKIINIKKKKRFIWLIG